MKQKIKKEFYSYINKLNKNKRNYIKIKKKKKIKFKFSKLRY